MIMKTYLIGPEFLFLMSGHKEHSCLKTCYIQHIFNIFSEELFSPFEVTTVYCSYLFNCLSVVYLRKKIIGNIL